MPAKCAIVQFVPTFACNDGGSSEGLYPAREPFTFDMTQTDQRGMVLIDACVPAAMAINFLTTLIEFREAQARIADMA